MHRFRRAIWLMLSPSCSSAYPVLIQGNWFPSVIQIRGSHTFHARGHMEKKVYSPGVTAHYPWDPDTSSSGKWHIQHLHFPCKFWNVFSELANHNWLCRAPRYYYYVGCYKLWKCCNQKCLFTSAGRTNLHTNCDWQRQRDEHCLSASLDCKSSTAILASWSVILIHPLCSLWNWKQPPNAITEQHIWPPYKWFTVIREWRRVETKGCGSLFTVVWEYQKGLLLLKLTELPFDVSISEAFCLAAP